MHFLIFSLKNSLLKIKHQWLLSLITVVAISTALFFPLLFSGMIRYVLQETDDTSFPFPEKTAIVDYRAVYMPQEEMEKSLNTALGGFHGYFSAIWDTVATSGDETALTVVNGAADSFFEQAVLHLEEGRLPSPKERAEGANVCVLKRNGRYSLMNLKEGDTMEINGTVFHVIGTVRSGGTSYGEVFIPYQTLGKLAGYNRFQYTAVETFDDTPQLSQLEGGIRRNGNFQFLNIENGKEWETIVKTSLFTQLRKQLILCLITLLLAISSIALILSGKVQNERYTYGVRIAVGATKSQLRWDAVWENGVIVAVAVVLDFILLPLLGGRLRLPADYVSPFSILLALIAGAAIVAIFTVLLIGKVYKQNPVQALRG